MFLEELLFEKRRNLLKRAPVYTVWNAGEQKLVKLHYVALCAPQRKNRITEDKKRIEGNAKPAVHQNISMPTQHLSALPFLLPSLLTLSCYAYALRGSTPFKFPLLQNKVAKLQ